MHTHEDVAVDALTGATFPRLAAARARLAQLEESTAENETDRAEQDYYRRAAETSRRKLALFKHVARGTEQRVWAKVPERQAVPRRTSRSRSRRRVTSGSRRARAPGALGDDPEPPPKLDLLDAAVAVLGWGRA
jgi:hypothetical protein